MRPRALGVLLLLVLACVTTEPRPTSPGPETPRVATLRRAAVLPWRDEGRCVVQQASHPWPVVVERCFHVLDTGRIRFRDTERRCPVASVDAASLETRVGICLLSQPELVVGAMVIIGVVVVAVAIKEELDAYELSRPGPEDVRPVPVAKPATSEPLANQKPKPGGSHQGGDPPPPMPPDFLEPREPRSECVPKRIPPKGGNKLHNRCADGVPFNAFRGGNVLVNGKAFDALQVVAGVLWEVKTDNFDTFPLELQDIVVRKQMSDLLKERRLAMECGFDFRVGVRSANHKAALQLFDITLDVVVMDWC
jgi:hypothetical protein